MGMQRTFYYTPTNKAAQEREWGKKLAKIRPHHKTNLAIAKAALLVLDMQGIFLNPQAHAYIPSSGTILPHIHDLITYFRQSHRPIIFTKHTTTNHPQDSMRRWWHNSISHNDPFSQISPFFDTTVGHTIEKHQYSAFFGTNLHEVLRKKDVTQIIVTGVMTHLCCETTARDGFMRNFDVFFPMNTTATYNEDLHLASLLTISHGFGDCRKYQDLLS